MFAHRELSLYGGHEDELHCLVFSRDLEILLTASVNGWLRLWNTTFDQLTFKTREQSGLIRAITISNEDRYFASAGNDTHVRLYETRTGSLLLTMIGHTHPCDCLCFSSDSQLLASGAWDCRTILWSVATGEPMHKFQHHTNAVQSISFHPTLKLMATGSHDHKICLYNLDQPQPLTPTYLDGHYGNVRTLAFSHLPYLASAGWDKVIVIWHIDMAHVRSRLTGHAGWIQAVTFHDDGSTLASIDDDTACIWNIFTSECLHRLPVVNDLSCSIRFIPNKNGLVVGGTVYELFANQSAPSRDVPRTKRVHESTSGESTMMSTQSRTRSRSKRVATSTRADRFLAASELNK